MKNQSREAHTATGHALAFTPGHTLLKSVLVAGTAAGVFNLVQPANETVQGFRVTIPAAGSLVGLRIAIRGCAGAHFDSLVFPQLL